MFYRHLWKLARRLEKLGFSRLDRPKLDLSNPPRLGNHAIVTWFLYFLPQIARIVQLHSCFPTTRLQPHNSAENVIFI